MSEIFKNWKSPFFQENSFLPPNGPKIRLLGLFFQNSHVFVCLLEQAWKFPTQTSDWCHLTSVLLVQFFLLSCYVHSNVFSHFFVSVHCTHVHTSIYPCESHKKDADLLLTLDNDITFLFIHLVAIL